MKQIPAFLMLAACWSLWGQMPSTDIYIADLLSENDGLKLENLKRITDRDGYDNQPYFLKDGALLYSSDREGATDIYRYDPTDDSHTRLTKTPEAEYSPMPTPKKKYFSTVRVDKDGEQRFYRYALNGGGEAELLLENTTKVAYYAWVDKKHVAMYLLTDPHSLQLISIKKGEAKELLKHPGRSLHMIPGEDALSVVHKAPGKPWMIKRLDLATQQLSYLLVTPVGSEDYAWTPDKVILIGQSGRLLMARIGDKQWRDVADLREQKIAQVMRIAVSPDGKRIAFVTQR